MTDWQLVEAVHDAGLENHSTDEARNADVAQALLALTQSAA
jgi:hypothetical protein